MFFQQTALKYCPIKHKKKNLKYNFSCVYFIYNIKKKCIGIFLLVDYKINFSE